MAANLLYPPGSSLSPDVLTSFVLPAHNQGVSYAPFTQNHISILTLQSVSTGSLAPGISLEKKIANVDTLNVRVSMPSRAYTSFLLLAAMLTIGRQYRVNALSGLYLISTLSITLIYSIITCVNALSGLYLISTYCQIL